jgi:hypothetical protein
MGSMKPLRPMIDAPDRPVIAIHCELGKMVVLPVEEGNPAPRARHWYRPADERHPGFVDQDFAGFIWDGRQR